MDLSEVEWEDRDDVVRFTELIHLTNNMIFDDDYDTTVTAQ